MSTPQPLPSPTSTPTARLVIATRKAAATIRRLTNWVIISTSRTNAVITAAVGILAAYFLAVDGVHTALTNDYRPCRVLGVSLRALAERLRRRGRGAG